MKSGWESISSIIKTEQRPLIGAGGRFLCGTSLQLSRLHILLFMLLLTLCLTQAGCIDTLASKAVTADENNAKPHLNRGASRNGYPWVVYPEVLAKWVREIPEITKGTPADEVIKRLGEPDNDYIAGPVNIWFSDRGADRCLQYNVVMELNFAGGFLIDSESITVIFDQNNRYKTYWVDNSLHPSKMNQPSPVPDQDLTSLMRE